MAAVEDDEDDCFSPFLVLADELITIILSYSFIDYGDLCRFSQTCSRFREIVNYSELWKKKALHRWKHWRNSKESDWKYVYSNRHLTEKEIVKVLDMLCIKYGSKADVSSSQYKLLIYLVNDHPYADWSQCILEEIIGGEPRVSNLTHQYYARRLYGYFLKLSLKKEWAELMERPPERQCLGDGALLIAKWIDHSITWNGSADKVKTKLDDMASRVQTILQERSASLECSLLSDHDRTMKIIEGIKHVMYEEEEFSGNSSDYYNVNNSLINQVLEKKKGIPISLAVIFVEIAQRLGVQIETVNSPNHFLLRYSSSQQLRDSQSPIYIDAFDKGRFYSQTQCYEQFISSTRMAGVRPESAFRTASPKDVFIRMVSNLVNIYHSYYRNGNGVNAFRNGIELLILVNPTDSKYKSLLAHVNLHLGINLDESIEMLQEMPDVTYGHSTFTNLIEMAQEKKYKCQQEEQKPIKQKFRFTAQNKEVQYRVGMVMRHVRYHYGCVIYGWDSFCDMHESWILQMGVDRLPLGRSQPFYNVLGDDGSSRYAAQENLIEEPDQPFNPNPDIGKYFKYWTGSRYIPNDYLSQRYPQDNQ